MTRSVIAPPAQLHSLRSCGRPLSIDHGVPDDAVRQLRYTRSGVVFPERAQGNRRQRAHAGVLSSGTLRDQHLVINWDLICLASDGFYHTGLKRAYVVWQPPRFHGYPEVHSRLHLVRFGCAGSMLSTATDCSFPQQTSMVSDHFPAGNSSQFAIASRQ